MPTIPQPLFPNDDGRANPKVLSALLESDQELVEALKGQRVFVAVLSQLISSDDTGGEKESEMALAVLSHEGSRALPIFTSIDALKNWREDARPVHVLAEAAGLQAITDEMSALIIDNTRVLGGPALRALVFDFPLVPVAQDPVVEAALEAAIAPHEEVVTAWLDVSDDVDATVNLLIPSLHSESASRVASAVAAWMAADPNVRLRTSKGFDVQVVTAR